MNQATRKMRWGEAPAEPKSSHGLSTQDLVPPIGAYFIAVPGTRKNKIP